MASKRLDLIFGLDDGDAVKGLKNIAKESKATGQSFDQLESKGKALARELAASGDKIEANLKGTKAAADALGDALGPELAGKLGRAKIEQTVQGFKELGLTFDEVKADAEALAAEIKRLDSISSTSGLDQVATSGDKAQTSLMAVRSEADKTGSVMANTVGNASQSLADSFGIAGVAGGTLGVTLGQLGEYAAEGGVSLAGLAKAAGPMIAVTATVAGIGKVMADRKREIEEFSTAISNTRKALAELGDAAPQTLFLKQALEALNDPANAANDELKELSEKAKGAGVSSATLAVAIASGTEAFKGWLRSQANAAGLSKQMEALLDGQASTQVNLTGATQDQVDAWGHLIDIYGQGDDVIRANDKALQENSDSVEYLLGSVQALDAFLQSTNPGDIANLIDPGILRDLKSELDAGGTGAKTFSMNAEELNAVIGERGPAAFMELIEAAGGATDELEDTNVELDKTSQAALNAKKRTQELAIEWGKLTGMLSAERSWDAVEDGFLRLEESAAAAYEAAAEGAEDAAEKAEAYRDDVLSQKEAIADYAMNVAKLPPEQFTQVMALIDQGKLQEAEDWLKWLTRDRNATINTQIIGKGGAGYGTPGEKRAMGGPTVAGRNYEVLEGGKSELLTENGKTYLMAGSDGMVTPLSAMPGAMASGASGGSSAPVVNVVVNAGMGTDGNLVGRQILDVVNRTLKQQGRPTL